VVGCYNLTVPAGLRAPPELPKGEAGRHRLALTSERTCHRARAAAALRLHVHDQPTLPLPPTVCGEPLNDTGGLPVEYRTLAVQTAPGELKEYSVG
jgi:hypothetical protein